MFHVYQLVGEGSGSGLGTAATIEEAKSITPDNGWVEQDVANGSIVVYKGPLVP